MKASEIGLPQELDELGLNWERSGSLGVFAVHKYEGVTLWGVAIYRNASGTWSKPEVSAGDEVLFYKDIKYMERILRAVAEAVERHHDGQTPSPEDVVRKTIELTIAETALTEVSASVYAKQASYERRHRLEQDIRNVAAEYAAQANLSSSGATAQEMAQAIESGIRDIGVIFGVES